MTVRSEGGVIHLEGHCGTEDVEPLLRHLLAAATPRVEWHRCEHAHTAIIQLLLNAQPLMDGAPDDVFLRHHIAPLLASQLAGGNAVFKA